MNGHSLKCAALVICESRQKKWSKNMLKEGITAPNFTAKNEKGETVRLQDLRGQKIVLYFYPKDDTPGCTKEACSFRDAFSDFKKRGIRILGVSLDSEASHQKFTAKYKLPFTLLADTDHSIADAYGVYGEKKFMGRSYMGVKRMTFLIDEKGKIRKVFEKVKPEEHAREVLEAF
jgi:thioredoxin-dependent peroxiredoxin